MTELTAATGTVGSGAFIVLGAILFTAGTVFSSDFRGIGTRYIRLTLRKTPEITEAQARIIRRNRIYYGIGAGIGLLMLLAGIFSL